MKAFIATIAPVLEAQHYPAVIRDNFCGILYANKTAKTLFGVNGNQSYALSCHQMIHNKGKPLKKCFCGAGSSDIKVTRFYEPSINAVLEHLYIPLMGGSTLKAALSVISVLDRPNQPTSIYRLDYGPVVIEGTERPWDIPCEGSAPLTKRESEVFGWIKKGKSSAEIASHMRITENTVNFHTKNIFVKLGADNRTHAVTIEHQSIIRDRDTLIKEIHHRVYNNFAILGGAVSLYAADIKRGGDALTAMHALQGHMQSMAALHEIMVNQAADNYVRTGKYFMSFAERIKSAFGFDMRSITLHTEVDDATLHMREAAACAMIAAELITNSVKHAFQPKQPGVIEMEFRRARKRKADNEFLLSVRDNGRHAPTNKAAPGSAGIMIVNSLVKQLGGSMETRTDKGTACSVRFKASSRMK